MNTFKAELLFMVGDKKFKCDFVGKSENSREFINDIIELQIIISHYLPTKIYIYSIVEIYSVGKYEVIKRII